MLGMTCVLCKQDVTLLDLDAEGYGGAPAHSWCAEATRQAVRDALDEANRMVVEDTDPRHHRRGVRPAAA